MHIITIFLCIFVSSLLIRSAKDNQASQNRLFNMDIEHRTVQDYITPKCAHIDIAIERGFDYSTYSTEEAPENDYGSF